MVASRRYIAQDDMRLWVDTALQRVLNGLTYVPTAPVSQTSFESHLSYDNRADMCVTLVFMCRTRLTVSSKPTFVQYCRSTA